MECRVAVNTLNIINTWMNFFLKKERLPRYSYQNIQKTKKSAYLLQFSSIFLLKVFGVSV